MFGCYEIESRSLHNNWVELGLTKERSIHSIEQHHNFLLASWDQDTDTFLTRNYESDVEFTPLPTVRKEAQK